MSHLTVRGCKVVCLARRVTGRVPRAIDECSDEIRPTVVLVPGRGNALGVKGAHVRRGMRGTIKRGVLWFKKSFFRG